MRRLKRRGNTGVLEDIRFMSDQIVHDTLSEGKINNNDNVRKYLAGNISLLS